MNTNEHIHSQTLELGDFGKAWDNFVAVVRGNLSTDKSIATKGNLPFTAYASHRLNKHVKYFLSDHEPVISQVNTLMVKHKKALQERG